MSGGTESSNLRPNGLVHDTPSTPPEPEAGRGPEAMAMPMAATLSQQSIPSTEAPPSPLDPASSFKTELNDDRPVSPRVIPSSLTPPPSSQPSQPNGAAGHPLGYLASQHRSSASMFSPPATTAARVSRHGQQAPAEYAPPTGDQIADASADDLRRMLHASLGENARLKMETAHHKLQYNLLSMQADEEAKRAVVEHDMTRREVEVLRVAESARQVRREVSAAAENTQVKYIQLKATYDLAMNDMDGLRKREKNFKKVLQQKEDEIIALTDERYLLLRRIRENREHFHMLCSPGGAFHGALTPKLAPAVATPQQHRTTPRQTPRSHRREHDHHQIGFQVLLEALSQDNNSAPSTPTSAHRPAPRMLPKHTRGAQSMSSLPTTPMAKSRGDHAALLPSIDLIPRTEPPHRFTTNRFVPDAQHTQRKSRESTISADDNNEELARAALNMAAVNRSIISNPSQKSLSHSHHRQAEEDVYESQASQAASEMLRRDPRGGFDEVASSVDSRDATPAPAEKSAKLQAKIFAPINKAAPAAEKRKYNGQAEYADSSREPLPSPAKKMRFAPGSADAHRVGLGIQYS
ncbi:hypothetical protein TruAng_001534 [Truncatella angustata]|nr:hypothetical protein TruAng_001534 [Truncatella angustata]